jgi:DNA-3-methyladenine glycosylase
MLRALPRRFYARDPLVVARELLGKTLVREYEGERLSAMITEVEAYLGSEDSASHAYKGPTPRNAAMFGPPGHAYVYLVYGLHNMLNVVAGPPGIPWAILIRGARALAGIDAMQRLRGRGRDIAGGPGKLAQALAIDRALDGWDLTQGDALWIAPGTLIPDAAVCTTARIGIDYAQPPHRDAPWRFLVDAAFFDQPR